MPALLSRSAILSSPPGLFEQYGDVVSHYLKNRHRFLDWRFLACVAALSFPSVDANAKVSAPQTIWAKAGVSREQFGAEALECGLQGQIGRASCRERVGQYV